MATTTTTDPDRRVLVYGTLRPGELNNSIVGWADAEASEAVLPGWQLLGLNRGFPYAIPAEGEALIGDVLSFPEWSWGDALAAMDMLEGVPHHYVRTVCTAFTDAGEVCAWIYTPAGFRPDCDPVPGGDWCAYSDARRAAARATEDRWWRDAEAGTVTDDDLPWWETYRDPAHQ